MAWKYFGLDSGRRDWVFNHIPFFFFSLNKPNLNSVLRTPLLDICSYCQFLLVCLCGFLTSICLLSRRWTQRGLALDNLCLAHSRLLVNICWINDRIQLMRVSNPWWPLKSFPNWTSCPSVSVMALDLWIDSHPHLCPLLSFMDAITCYQ